MPSVEELRDRLQLLCCGQSYEFSTWPELVSEVGAPSATQLKRIVRAIPGAKYMSPFRRLTNTSAAPEDDKNWKHTIRVPLSDDQETMLSTIRQAGPFLSVVINDNRALVLNERFGLERADVLLDAFVLRGIVHKSVRPGKTVYEVYTLSA